MKPRSERDKRYEEKHKNERKAKSVVWGTSIPRETAEEIDAFLKKHRYTKRDLFSLHKRFRTDADSENAHRARHRLAYRMEEKARREVSTRKV